MREPELSVVVVTPDTYDTVRKTVRHLRAQAKREVLEIVLVAPSADRLQLDVAEMGDFFGHKIIEVGHMSSTARARAAGVRAASARVVAFVEDHAFPAPGWAEALIHRHREDWAAVGPVMTNANPRSTTSWANLLIEYAQWLEPDEGGEREHLPGHNGSYKRDILLPYGDRLEAMLDAESILHWDLRARGHRLWLEPKARTFHQNFSVPFSSIPLRFNGGRLFAASRSRAWSLPRRALFTVAAPLIPFVRCLRIVRELSRPGRPRHMLPRLLPALIVGLAFDGAGEMVGYALGAGDAMRKLSDMEFHRERYLSEGDRRGRLASEEI
ncbi:MAG TPA: glycosyltransferase [Pyrinomonadaceae bacterium]|jgi:glycosyltransferase involved in cell wall biosynthesis